LIGALREESDASFAVHELETDINDPAFARAMADARDQLH
jgi:hypothetical protein